MTRPSDVWKCRELDSDEKIVLLALLDYGERAYPRQETLAQKCGLCRRTCRRVVGRLRQRGYLATSSKGKALSYRVVLRGQGGRGRSATVAAEMGQGGRATAATVAAGSELSYGTSPPNYGTAKAVTGGGGPFHGIDPDMVVRIRRWHSRMSDSQVDELAVAQRSALSKRLAALGRKDVRGWWKALVDRWSRTGIPPYDCLAASLEELGADVRDPVALVAFRLGIGRVAA